MTLLQIGKSKWLNPERIVYVEINETKDPSGGIVLSSIVTLDGGLKIPFVRDEARQVVQELALDYRLP